jgi:hypothetical protein
MAALILVFGQPAHKVVMRRADWVGYRPAVSASTIRQAADGHWRG